MKQYNISSSEWEVMRVVWNKQKVGSKEVCKCLSHVKGWQTTTIKTLLSRLVTKGLIKTTKEGNKYIYQAKYPQDQSLNLLTDDLLTKICATKVGSLLETIITKTKLTNEDIDMLEKALKLKRTEAVTSIECNCLPGQCYCHPAECNCHEGVNK